MRLLRLGILFCLTAPLSAAPQLAPVGVYDQSRQRAEAEIQKAEMEAQLPEYAQNEIKKLSLYGLNLGKILKGKGKIDQWVGPEAQIGVNLQEAILNTPVINKLVGRLGKDFYDFQSATIYINWSTGAVLNRGMRPDEFQAHLESSVLEPIWGRYQMIADIYRNSDIPRDFKAEYCNLKAQRETYYGRPITACRYAPKGTAPATDRNKGNHPSPS